VIYSPLAQQRSIMTHSPNPLLYCVLITSMYTYKPFLWDPAWY